MTLEINLTVNGKKVSQSVAPETTLATFVREELQLMGTHIGCDSSQCGACTVHLNGRAVKACTVLVAQTEGQQVTTIEGIGTPDELHPMQAAFRECHGLQCGFCTPGMIMASIDLVHRGEAGSEEEIRDGLEGNYCRCTGYHNIVKAVAQAAPQMTNK